MHIFTLTVKRTILPAIIIWAASGSLYAQQDSVARAAADSVAAVRKDESRTKASGTVTESSTGKPLPGISISVPGYSASITNANGEFKVSVPDYQAVIVITGQGYQTKEVALKGRKEVRISLFEENYNSVYAAAQLPYATKPLNHIPVAVTNIDVADSWQRSSESPDTYLQGRVPGLDVTRRSGTPGIGANLLLRGYNSLYATNQPAIFVDGILYDNSNYGVSLISGHSSNPLANIDIKDIDNISVLKDAAASAYGTKGANGVILITTARAKEQATRIDFSAYGGFNFKPSNLPVMGISDYRIYLSDLLKSASLTSAQIQSLPFMNDDTNPATNPNYFRYHYNTNWQDQVMSNSFNNNYYLKITGGDNIATYGLSVGYLKNEGITDQTDLSRYQTRFNADLNLSAKLKGTANLSFVSNEQALKNQGIANKTNPLYLGLVKAPFLPIQDVSESGAVSPNYAGVDIFNVSNPVAVINNMQANDKNYRFQGSVGFDYAVNKALGVKVLMGVTYDKVRENIFVPNKGIVPDTLSAAVALNQSGSNVERLYSLFSDARLTYAKTFNNMHNLSANAGFRFNDNSRETDYGLGYNSATDDYVSVTNGQALLRRVSGDNGKWRSINSYLNADYELKNKYFLSFNLAVDGSSRFGKEASAPLTIGGNQLAVLPSIAAGWLLSSESFLADSRTIESLKLRASYGLTANDDIGNYSARQYYVTQNFLGSQGLVRGNLANPALKWETVKKLNAGIDASFLGERLGVTVDVFRNTTSDMLVYEPVNNFSGFTSVLTNNGGMKSHGAELNLNGRLINKVLKWDAAFNISAYRNEVTRIPNDRLTTEYAGATILTQKGMAPNLFYGYKTNGVYASDAEAASAGLSSRTSGGVVTAFKGGDVRFVNTNGDSFIDEQDMQVIGNPNPDFTGMFSNAFSWKRFSMDAILTFSSGNDIYNYVRRGLESMNGFQNQTEVVLNRWKANGQVTNTPRVQYGDPVGNARFSDRWIEDGSYIRLRTISVSYDVPFKAKGFKYAKVYLTGNNVLTASKYLGFDPEFSASGSVFNRGVDTGLEPQFRSVQLGIRVGL
ncbi:SusC/RagA family TonB-linked outer membrane protein [Hufsiella ginkgonis]|uniref:SusC/RagA family TonB-linked outer membrane protein n=1 Tax=Hufsiella ginkgonis TaxID=2695274 RepID=A0A7K1Y2M8_9SPHI|nr:SusC/RagA family TonB-linked outer membrane protein [Hufsiella ginkgonis]MXV17338.1 SusC/RagA family TonB-linked outer membrane protein [Hufsiella ginkgonis]